ncbi:MAG: ATP-binding protein [Acidobacteria bacterium]|nr:ATP-binding protein [Acidobacteriota bacterium]
MIVQFFIRNFRSFGTEQELNLLAAPRLTDHLDTHTYPLPGSTDRILRLGFLYGPNAAGKSNLIRALNYLKQLATGAPAGPATGGTPFAFSANPSPDTELDLTFLAGDRLLRYGLISSATRIEEEWLLEIHNGRETVIFERVTSTEGISTIKGKDLKSSGPKVAILAHIAPRAHKTFLGSLLQSLELSEISGPIRLALDWFSQQLVILGPESSWLGKAGLIASDDALRQFMDNLLSQNSTGVSKLDVWQRAIEREDLPALFGGTEAARHAEQALQSGQSALATDWGEVHFENGRFHVRTLVALHEGPTGSRHGLPLEEESDGTRRLLDLGPFLHTAAQSPGVFVIDELDRSLHPNLLRRLVEIFLHLGANRPTQLFATTHEAHLLDQGLLRRDEVWLAEKSLFGETTLNSIAEFRVRKDLRLDSAYIEGRFGAIPNLQPISDKPSDQ